MESTVNFKAGLTAAYNSLAAEGRLTARDERAVGQLIANPVMVLPDGQHVLAMKRVHLRIRRYYARTIGGPLPFKIDWTQIVDWIKEHWVEVVRIILTILPFLFL